MDKYDAFVKDVLLKTKKNEISWDGVPPGKYTEFIFQASSAYQAFETHYVKEGRKYTLVLVHKKMPTYNDDFDMVVEKHRSELLVIESKVLVITLNDSYVDEKYLSSLALEIEDKNQSAIDLFKGFEDEDEDDGGY